MSYYFEKTIKNLTFEEAEQQITEKLKDEGFGILTEIDVQNTLKSKLDVDFRKYKILGACNPPFSHKALTAEPNIGLMLPCNVVVQEKEDKTVNVTVVDPVASMQAVNNDELKEVAKTIKEKLQKALANL